MNNRRRISSRRRRRSTIKLPAFFTPAFWTKTRIIIAAAVALILAAAIAVICIVTAVPTDPSKVTDEQLLKMKFKDGVSVEGVDVSGMIFADAIEPVGAKADDILKNLSVTYKIEEDGYKISAYDMGASINYPATMKEAMFGEPGEYDFTIDTDEKKIESAVTSACIEHTAEPKDAEVSLNVNSSESNLMVTADMVISDSVTGKDISAETLSKQIAKAAVERKTDSPVIAEIKEEEPKWSKEFLEKNMNIMGEYTTTFNDSGYGRCYNIWKMSTVVCGVVLMPGETWSINKAAGDRTTENGWKDAAGIKNGAYVDEPGGGICQVSSTLYNACLRSEVTVVERSHHSWPLKYVPVGLDATISTGAPDFVISNPYDTPIVLAVRTEAGGAQKYVRVRVYGPEMDYKLNFTSEVIKEDEPEPAKTTVDPSLSPGTSKEVSPRHNAITVQIYKHVLDKNTGEEIEKVEFCKEYYASFRGTIAYGPEPSETPSPEASNDPEASASAEPQPSESPKPSKKAE